MIEIIICILKWILLSVIGVAILYAIVWWFRLFIVKIIAEVMDGVNVIKGLFANKADQLPQQPISSSKMSAIQSGNYVVQSLVVTISAAVLFIAAAIISDKYFNLSYEAGENVILIFIGILATFIVVSNYAQVVEIKKEFTSKVEKIDAKTRRIDKQMQESATKQVKRVNKSRIIKR